MLETAQSIVNVALYKNIYISRGVFCGSDQELSNKHLRIVIAISPTFRGWRTTAQTPKHTAAAEIIKIRWREGKTVLVNKRSEAFLGSFKRFTFITTSAFNSGTVSLLSGDVEATKAPDLIFSVTLSCNSKSQNTNLIEDMSNSHQSCNRIYRGSYYSYSFKSWHVSRHKEDLVC